jgi:hypothetical protein
MTSVGATRTQGYSEEAETLLKQYESIPFCRCPPTNSSFDPDLCEPDLGYRCWNRARCRRICRNGHIVVAAEFRTAAAVLRPSPQIEWVEDALPELASLIKRGETFDVVMLTAVWMHLDEQERYRAMPTVARLVRPAGVLSPSLRYGP